VVNGLVPERDIEIKFTGLKAGDKMYEELFRAGDIRKDTGHSEIFAAVPAEADAGLSDACRAELQQLAAGADKAAILGKIKALVPAYTGWPRKSRIENRESKIGEKEGEARKTKGELGGGGGVKGTGYFNKKGSLRSLFCCLPTRHALDGLVCYNIDRKFKFCLRHVS